jgi:hypothetical protein
LRSEKNGKPTCKHLEGSRNLNEVDFACSKSCFFAMLVSFLGCLKTGIQGDYIVKKLHSSRIEFYLILLFSKTLEDSCLIKFSFCYVRFKIKYMQPEVVK